MVDAAYVVITANEVVSGLRPAASRLKRKPSRLIYKAQMQPSATRADIHNASLLAQN
jgi:hypothetical protein